MEKYNPIEQMHNMLSVGDRDMDIEYITYDPKVNSNFDFLIQEGERHDGTLIFTFGILEKVFLPLINKQYAGKLTEEQIKNLKDLKYTVGNLTIDRNYGTKIKHFTGMTEKMSLPVKCEYIFN